MFDNVTNVEEVLLVCSYSRMMVEQQSLPCYAYHSGSAARVLFNVAEASFAAKKEW